MSGIGQRTLRDMLNSRDPMPYIRIGSKRLIQRDALPEYLKKRQEVKR
jgi:excisionase family DNA binding protein